MAELSDHSQTPDSRFGFSKLFVRDLAAMDAYYRNVFEMREMQRGESRIFGGAVSQIIYAPSFQGGPTFALLSWHDARMAVAGEAITGFITRDLEALVLRARRAGGMMSDPINRLDAEAMLVAHILDPEGHVAEAVQILT